MMKSNRTVVKSVILTAIMAAGLLTATGRAVASSSTTDRDIPVPGTNCAQTIELDDSAICNPAQGSKVQSVKVLAATAFHLIKELPVSEDHKDFAQKQQKILRALKKVISVQSMPVSPALNKIKSWLLTFHNLAVKENVYGPNSIEMVLFTGNISIAQGYLHIAEKMADNYHRN